MLVLCLILGILAGFGSALFALVSGYGITGIIVAYAIGGCHKIKTPATFKKTNVSFAIRGRAVQPQIGLVCLIQCSQKRLDTALQSRLTHR